MEKEIRKNGRIAGICFAAFLLLILLVKTVDVAAIGPNETGIGLSRLNSAVKGMGNVHLVWAKLTDTLAWCSMGAGFLLCCGAPLQFVKTWSLKKVNKVLLVLIAFYFLLGLIYVFFEVVVINLRPILEAGETMPEPSFPSSHTVLCCSVLGSFLVVLGLSGEKSPVSTAVKVMMWVFMVLAVVGRIISGVHWVTDIIGGVLLSLALVFGLKAVLMALKKWEDGRKRK